MATSQVPKRKTVDCVVKLSKQSVVGGVCFFC